MVGCILVMESLNYTWITSISGFKVPFHVLVVLDLDPGPVQRLHGTGGLNGGFPRGLLWLLAKAPHR